MMAGIPNPDEDNLPRAAKKPPPKARRPRDSRNMVRYVNCRNARTNNKSQCLQNSFCKSYEAHTPLYKGEFVLKGIWRPFCGALANLVA